MKSTAATLAALVGYATAQNAYAYGAASTTTPASYPTTTSSCPAPGTTGSDGRYSCNPAHQYPTNQFCVESDGCYYLVDQGPGVSATPSSTATAPSYPTASCPAPGTNGTDGRYSCNPAHTYPANQFCVLSNGCYYLVNQGPGVSASAPPSYETTIVSSYTTVCPGPTTITQNGKTYPVTSATTLTITHCPGGCTITKPAVPTSTGSVCPAPGATDSMGRYSCNPAHTYPTGQTCTLVNGCYFLITGSVSSGVIPPTSMYVVPSTTAWSGNGTATASTPVAYTGGANAMATAAPAFAVAALGALFL